jgi:hypothetical protein
MHSEACVSIASDDSTTKLGGSSLREHANQSSSTNNSPTDSAKTIDSNFDGCHGVAFEVE